MTLAERLIARGATVNAYDPAAGPNATAQVPGLRVKADAASAVDGADVIVIATEWPEFRDLPWADWAAAPDRPLVVDGRRLLDAGSRRALGWRFGQLGDGRDRDRPVAAATTRRPKRPDSGSPTYIITRPPSTARTWPVM